MGHGIDAILILDGGADCHGTRSFSGRNPVEGTIGSSFENEILPVVGYVYEGGLKF